MCNIDLGNNNLNKRYFEAVVKKYALMYISMYPKNLQYKRLEKYINEVCGIKANLYSICYYIIARSKLNHSDNDCSVIISPTDEYLYRLITYGNRDVRGINILYNAFTNSRQRRN